MQGKRIVPGADVVFIIDYLAASPRFFLAGFCMESIKSVLSLVNETLYKSNVYSFPHEPCVGNKQMIAQQVLIALPAGT